MSGRTVRKNFRLTEHEAKLLASRASRIGITETDFICSLIADPTHVFVADDGGLRRIYRELKHEGVNLNQLARIYNSRKDTTSELIAVKRCLGNMARIMEELEDVLASVPRRK